MNTKLKRAKIYVLHTMLLLLFISCASGNKKAYQEAGALQKVDERVSGQYIVTLNKAGNGGLLQDIFSPHKAVSIEKISDTVFLLQLERDPTPAEIQSYLENDIIHHRY